MLPPSRNKHRAPTTSPFERGHFSGGGVEVRERTGDAFYCVCKAANFGLFNSERAVSGRRIFAGGENVHKGKGRKVLVTPLPVPLFSEERRAGRDQSSLRSIKVIAGGGPRTDDREAEHPNNIPKTARFVLGGNSGWDGDTLIVNSAPRSRAVAVRKDLRALSPREKGISFEI